MTKTTAPQTWGQTLKTLVLGLLPSLNTSLVAIVTAAVSIGGTVAAQHWAAPQSAKSEVAKTAPAISLSQIMAELAEIKDRLIKTEGYGAEVYSEMQALRLDFKTPRAVLPKRAPKRHPGAVDTSTR